MADHAEVCAHPRAARGRRGIDADGEIVRVDDERRMLALLAEAMGEVLDGARVEWTAEDLARQTPPCAQVEERSLPRPVGDEVRGSGDEHGSAMAAPTQLVEGQGDGLNFVRPRGDYAVGTAFLLTGRRTVEGDQRTPGGRVSPARLADALRESVQSADRGDGDSRDMLCGQPAQCLLLSVGGVVGADDQEGGAVDVGALLHAAQDVEEQRVAHVPDDDPVYVAVAGAQGPRPRIRCISEGICGGPNARSGHGRDAPGAVEREARL